MAIMYTKEVLAICLLFTIIHNAVSYPVGIQSPMNTINNFNQKMLPEAPGTPLITELVPSLQFGDITVTGDLPVGGSIRVKGCFPVYGTVAVDGGLPSSGTAVVNAGTGVVTQVV